MARGNGTISPSGPCHNTRSRVKARKAAKEEAMRQEYVQPSPAVEQPARQEEEKAQETLQAQDILLKLDRLLTALDQRADMTPSEPLRHSRAVERARVQGKRRLPSDKGRRRRVPAGKGISITDRAQTFGYPTPSLRDCKEIGKQMVGAYRQLYEEEPPKREQRIGNRNVAVNHYTLADWSTFGDEIMYYYFTRQANE